MIVSNIALVGLNLVRELKNLLLFKHDVYDPSLSYESSLAGLRNLRTEHNSVESSEILPYLAHNRTSVKKSDSHGFRSYGTALLKDLVDPAHPTATEINYVLGQFEFNCFFATKDIQDIQRFEVIFNHNSFPKLLHVYHDGGLGDWEYAVNWHDISELTLTIEGKTYQSIGTSATVRGIFFYFDDSPVPLIAQINEALILLSRTSIFPETLIDIWSSYTECTDN